MKQQGEQGTENKPFHQLKELGFEQIYIRKALAITSDIEKASEIILKLADEGLEADLSEFISQKNVKINQEKQGFFQNVTKKYLSKAKMLFVVNGELKMGKGKICAQVGHAVIGAYIQIQEEARYDEKSRTRLQNWQMYGSAKIVVKAENTKQLVGLDKKLKALDIGINTYLVEDAGHTQIEAGSLTVLAIGPAFSQEIDNLTKHLKLL